MNISFAWTTPALVTGNKTVTRRDWKPEYAHRFAACDIHDAYDKSPRFGGQRIGTIELTHPVALERTSQIEESDWTAEGFAYLEANNKTLGTGKNARTPGDIWCEWRDHPCLLYVVRFKLLTLTEYGHELLKEVTT